MTVNICNCNSISKAIIEISENCLNIKYGENGTGKTTIGHAIRYHVTNGELAKLKPYWLSDDGKPSVITDRELKSVKVFDTDYINSFLFQHSDDIFTDSFQVLLHNEVCDELLAEIEEKFKDFGNILLSDDSISDIYESNHVENDYIFQLNPVRFQTIPNCFFPVIDKIIDLAHSVLI